ncbi:homoserine dehydrogenase [Clostridium gasigenes]|uniref:homoserine dehydrogenase n=1 Tax=Clostridium gasigenes TaxID=94869 RepID=UPI001C0CB6F1|nr:homoserine dehydrogenase [Clostridium gasigenes]MBU3104753.1 homoserine dehydrogenase [Clostridium gasigenes]
MIKIAIIGYGVVGSGLVELIDENREANKCHEEIVITSILVRNKEKHKNKNHSEVLTTDIEEFFSKESDIVVEVMGEITKSLIYVKRALNLKKHVVTANKDLLAEYGEELFELANENGVALKFEASIGGGIPVIKSLIESLEGNNINSIKAILNGTTNFILTKMDKEKLSYEEALKEAQELGFAEDNPEADVMGYDAARKLSLLSTLAFRKKVSWKNINIQGITEVESVDFDYADKINCKVKLLCISNNSDDGVYATVKPVLVENESVLAQINNEVNIVIFNGDAIGEIILIGKGAGKMPTGSAVYADVLDIVNNRFTKITAFKKEGAKIIENLQGECSAVLRIENSKEQDIIKKCANEFTFIQVLQKQIEGETGVLVKANSEIEIDRFIDGLFANSYVKSIKKIIKID